VESPVLNIVELPATVGAHAEGFHSGSLPVVRQRPDDAESGTATGAVGKGVVPAPDLGTHILQTGVANGEIGAYTGRFSLPGIAGEYGKIGKSFQRGDSRGYGLDFRRRGGVLWKGGEKSADIFGISFDPDAHAVGSVYYPSCKTIHPGKAIDVGPKTHPLNEAGDADLYRDFFIDQQIPIVDEAVNVCQSI
jgi:hypothetical protein